MAEYSGMKPTKCKLRLAEIEQFDVKLGADGCPDGKPVKFGCSGASSSKEKAKMVEFESSDDESSRCETRLVEVGDSQGGVLRLEVIGCCIPNDVGGSDEQVHRSLGLIRTLNY